MKKLTVISAAAMLACAVMTVPALAQDAERVALERVSDRDEITLDPAGAYLLVEGPGMFVSNFFLEPTEEERADWAIQREEELAEAIARYENRVLRYERQLATWERRRNTRDPRPQPPELVNAETFSWPALETFKVFSIGPQNRFAINEGSSLWLYELPEGEYTFYGTGLVGLNDCACMGTVRFSVEAGSVTAVRVGIAILDERGNEIDEPLEDSDSTDRQARMALVIDEPSPSAYDPRIPRSMIRPAEFVAVPRLPNWFGGTINRIRPIPGQFDYHHSELVAINAPSEAGERAAVETVPGEDGD